MADYSQYEKALMEGGHSMPEIQDEDYGFIGSLGEARMFKTREQISREGARSLTDHLFVSLLSLYAMSNDYKYAPVAGEYAQRTVQRGNFNNPAPSGSDLYQTIFTLKRGDKMFNDPKDSTLMKKVKVNDTQIKRFLQQLNSGNLNRSQVASFFYKMERDLKIQDPKLRAARRLVQDWENLNTQQRQLVGTQLNRYYRTSARRSDLNPIFGKFAKDNALVIGDDKKKKIRNTVLALGAGIAAGYAAGKATKL